MKRLTSKFVFILRWGFRIFLLFLIVDLFYVAATWPDWKQMARGPIPKTNFIKHYQAKRKKNRSLPRLLWQTAPLHDIPDAMQRAVIVAEDSRFFMHKGFDLIAFKEAMDYNWNKGRMVFGGSTITQQTVKNLFLSSARTPIRKWHEIILTWGIEANLRKNRIMEIYLNTAEFGPGIYGVESAAQYYWGQPASRLSWRQCAELAATLPSPRKHNPQTRTKRFLKRSDRVMLWMKKHHDNAEKRKTKRQQRKSRAQATHRPGRKKKRR